MSAQTVFDTIAPQFKDRTDKGDFIALAATRTSEAVFGDTFAQAVALRAAHMMTLTVQRSQGEAGAVASKREGSLGISYAASGTDDLSQTHYGLQLKNLAKGSIPFVGVTGGAL